MRMTVFVSLSGVMIILVSGIGFGLSPSEPYVHEANNGNTVATVIVSNKSLIEVNIAYPSIIATSIHYLLSYQESFPEHSNNITIKRVGFNVFIYDKGLNEGVFVWSDHLRYFLNDSIITVNLTGWNGFSNNVTNITGSIVGAVYAVKMNLFIAATILLNYPYLFMLQDQTMPGPGGGGSGGGTYGWGGTGYSSYTLYSGSNEEWQISLQVSLSYSSTEIVSGSQYSTIEAPYSYGSYFFYGDKYVISDSTGFALAGSQVGYSSSKSVGIPAGSWDYNYVSSTYVDQNTRLYLAVDFEYAEDANDITTLVDLSTYVTIPQLT